MPQSDLPPCAVLPEPEALYAAACVAWREGQREYAISRLDEALRRRPDFAEALSMGGFILSERGKPEAALRFYRQALNFNPSLVVAHVNSGKLLFDARRFAEALAAFEAATALAPNDADAWCSRAQIMLGSARISAPCGPLCGPWRWRERRNEIAIHAPRSMSRLGEGRRSSYWQDRVAPPHPGDLSWSRAGSPSRLGITYSN
jgi:tetratricopeptide (TPR) repeat protein